MRQPADIRFISTIVLISIFLGCAPSKEVIFNADPERISKDVHYLASDELEGRLAGTEGCEKAAEYIKGQFEKNGILPGDLSDGDYYQGFNITSGVTLASENSLEIVTSEGTISAELETDFLPMFFSPDGKVSGELVFAGYGITAEQFGWDDYEKVDATGKIVMCLKDEPGKNDPDSVFDGILPTTYSGLRWKAFNAKAHGAIGLIIAAGPNFIKEGEKDEFIGLQQPGIVGEVGIPVIQVSQEIADLLFSTMGAPLGMYHAEIERHGMAFGAAIPDIQVSFSVDCERTYVNTSNVLGVLEGNDPERKDEWVLVGAHYDHLGRGFDTSLSEGKGEIHNGADDNASGTSGILELARIFGSMPEPPSRSMMFIGFSAEEMGVLGSSAFIANCPVPKESISAMINMDMIGRPDTDEDGNLTCQIHASGSALEWKDILPEKSPDGSITFKQIRDPIGGGDYTTFYLADIPTLNFFTGSHSDYHRPSDDADTLNYEGEASVVDAVHDIALAVANYPTKLTYQESEIPEGELSRDTGARRSYSVSLGTVPDYERANEGCWIKDVVPGSPAEVVGMKGGDKIIKIGDYDVSDLHTFSFALGEYEPGETVDIIVIRDGKEMRFTITFGERRKGGH